MTARILAVSPHPDDEVLGAGGALAAAAARGQRAEVLAVSLGRAADRDRRRGELRAATAHLGVGLEILQPPLAMSQTDDLVDAERRLREELEVRFARTGTPDVLIAPAPHDAHHAHELVARAVRDAVVAAGEPTSVWWWRFWGQGGHPTVAVALAEEVYARVAAAMACHAGEIARMPYDLVLDLRTKLDAVLGAEQIHGFGADAWAHDRVSLYCETVYAGGTWSFAEPRCIAGDGLIVAGVATAVDSTAWLFTPSPWTALR